LELSTGVTDTIVARWRRTDPQFRAAAAQVNAETADRLERIADAIATGELDGTPTQLQALQFRLRGLRPDVYRERSSVTVDATTRIAADGDGGRARLLLAEWSNPQSAHMLPTNDLRGQIVDRLGTNLARLTDGKGDATATGDAGTT
jgi:HAMP domain-containing protein